MSNELRTKAIRRLGDLADAGIDHPNAITFGAYRDFLDHRLILATISSDHAEARRLHREFVEDGLITAPHQTSRRLANGSRRSLQVQRISFDRINAERIRLTHQETARAFEAVTCQNCPHDGPESLPMMEDPVHIGLVYGVDPTELSNPRASEAGW